MNVLTAKLAGALGAMRLDVELSAGPSGLLLAGENGAGKTSVLRFILGAKRPSFARVMLGERTLVDSERHIALAIEDRRLGYVPQHQALFPHLTARENVAFGVRGTASSSEKQARADEVLRKLDAIALADRRPSALSGGERQRVALARALASRPEALLLDEPFAALDPRARGEVRDMLAHVLAERTVPFILVAHDLRDTEGLATDVAILERGKIAAAGAIEALRIAPPTPFVAQLLAR